MGIPSAERGNGVDPIMKTIGVRSYTVFMDFFK